MYVIPVVDNFLVAKEPSYFSNGMCENVPSAPAEVTVFLWRVKYSLETLSFSRWLLPYPLIG